MGRVGDWLTGRSPVVDAAIEYVEPVFAVDESSIDPAVFGIAAYESPTAPAPRIDRRAAIQVPAVKRCRDLIAGTIGGLPLDLYNAQREQVASSLFEQPEKHRPRSVTMTQTIEDLLFEGIAWWRITETDWRGFPTSIKILKPQDVSVDETAGKVYVNGKHVPDDELIRFDSPNDALLVAGARAIRTCLRLDVAAGRYADGTPPVDWFESEDPVDDPAGLVADWNEARTKGVTGFVPWGVKYQRDGWTPEQLQMADARQHAVVQIANMAGVDSEALNVSTTSRTYFNAEHKRKELVDFTLGGYLISVEGRLSMNDVSPRGHYAKHDLDAFLRSDTKTRMETYEIGLRVGAYTLPEIREAEDKPATELPAPAPVRALPAPREAAS